ncbi:hypothetical protein ABZX77_15140 [Streptomyces sp. NPDC004237]|uniref:hypothetical protein n=1 Tax=Streptomyces sp. NPDC004237 TaxID=3154455 RepID=UPI0033B8B760
MPFALPGRGCPRYGDAARDPAARAPEDVARAWWTAALDASLPPDALADAGYFANSALTDEVWLPLARRSAEHTPAQTCAGDVVEGAAGHPHSPDALLLAAHLLTRPGPRVRRRRPPHARALLQAAIALAQPSGPSRRNSCARPWSKPTKWNSLGY